MRIQFNRPLLLSFVFLVAWQAHASPKGVAPASIAGMDVVLTIESAESPLPDGYPTTGAVVQSYSADGTYAYHGAGGSHHQTGTGTYSYIKTGDNTAEEQAMQYAESFTLPYIMEYTFESPVSGKWIQYFADGLIVFQGSFAISPSDAYREWAPVSLGGHRLILKSDPTSSRQRDNRLALEYTATTFHSAVNAVGQCRGQKIVRGNYTQQKMSARSLVEEGAYVDGGQYVRVYTFTHRNRGVWYEQDLTAGTTSSGRFRTKI